MFYVNGLLLKGSGELENLEDHWFEDPSWLNKLP